MSNLTVNTENLSEQERELLLALVEKSQKACDPMEFENRQKYYYINERGDLLNDYWESDIDAELFNFGNAYHTKEQAEIASEAMRRFNRILQFAILHGRYREFNKEGNNTTVYYDVRNKYWAVWSFDSLNFQSVYMTEECAELLCEKLNSGEYKI